MRYPPKYVVKNGVLNLVSSDITEIEFEKLEGEIETITSIILTKTMFNDEGLAQLNKVPNLSDLNLTEILRKTCKPGK